MDSNSISAKSFEVEENEGLPPLKNSFQTRVPRSQRIINSSTDASKLRLSAPESALLSTTFNGETELSVSLPISNKDNSALNITRKIAEDIRNSVMIDNDLGSQDSNKSSIVSPGRNNSDFFANSGSNLRDSNFTLTLFSSSNSTNNAGNTSTISSGKKRRVSPQLLHKRLNQMKIKEAPTSESINNFNLEDMILSSNIQQWLVYSWIAKAKDKNMRDRVTQTAVGDILILKHYALTNALCGTLSASQLEQAAKIILNVFQDLHLVFRKPKQGLERSSSNASSTDESRPSASSPNSPKILTSEDSFGKHAFKHPPIPMTKRRDHLLGFLNAVISEEVSEAKSEATLFRGNNITSKLLTLYANQAVKEYLSQVLAPALKKVVAMGSMEVDPTKLAGASSDNLEPKNIKEIAAENMKRLLDASKIVLDAITTSIDKVPKELRKISFLIQEHIEKKFGTGSSYPSTPKTASTISMSVRLSSGEAQSPISPTLTSPITPIATTRTHQVALSGFIFLRFICPTIVTPDAFMNGLTSSGRRSLVLISKVLQNIANGVKFGGKEAYMIGANPFLEYHERSVVNYCQEIHKMSEEDVFYVHDDEKVRKGPEFESSLVQLMSLFNLQMEKILPKLEQVLINESVTFSIFGALKPVLKKFDAIEKAHQIVDEPEKQTEQIPGSPTQLAHTNPLQFTKKDAELMTNFLLLGGLEEILLMNRFVIIRGMLNPENFIGSRPFTQMNFDDEDAEKILLREMDILTKSSVNILAPHGAFKVCELFEWVVDREEKLFEEKYNLSRSEYFKFLIESTGNTSCEEFIENMYEKSVAKRILAAILQAHVRELFKPSLSLLLEDIQESEHFEIDPEVEPSEEKVKLNFENMINLTVKIFDQLVNAKSIPDSLKRIFRFLVFRTSNVTMEEESSTLLQLNDSESLRDLSNLFFQRFLFNIIGSPYQYGLVTSSSNQRIFVIIASMLKFLARSNSLEEKDEEILMQVREHFQQNMQVFISTLLTSPAVVEKPPQPIVSSVSPSPREIGQTSGIPLSLIIKTSETHESQTSLVSNKSRNSIIDPPLYTPTVARAKAVVYMRKMLTGYAIRKLKAFINTREAKSPKEIKFNEAELFGIRVETINYRLNDRVKCIFWSLYGKKNSHNSSSNNSTVSMINGGVGLAMKQQQPIQSNMELNFVSTDDVNQSQQQQLMGGKLPISKNGTLQSSNTTGSQKKDRKWLSTPISSYAKLVRMIFSGGSLSKHNSTEDGIARRSTSFDPLDESNGRTTDKSDNELDGLKPNNNNNKLRKKKKK